MEEFKVANNFFFDIIYMYVEGVSTIDDAFVPLKIIVEFTQNVNRTIYSGIRCDCERNFTQEEITYKVTKY